MEDILINYGASIKTLEKSGDLVTLGAHGILWGTSLQRDVVGDWFTKETTLGATKGVGVDTMLHHGLPLKADLPQIQKYSQILLPPTVKAEPDDIGLLVATVFDMRDGYQRKIAEMCEAGALSWSSGANPRGVVRANKAAAGEILQWPLIEFSFTPTPAEPRMAGITPLKSIMELPGVNEACTKAVRVLTELEPEPCVTDEVKAEGKLSFADHSEKVLAAISEFSERVDGLVALRANSRKTGKVLSQNNYDRLSQYHSSMKGLTDDMGDLLEQYKPQAAPENPEGTPEDTETIDAQLLELEAQFQEQSFQIDEVLSPVEI